MGPSFQPAINEAHLADEYELFRRSEKLRALTRDTAAIIEDCRESARRLVIASAELAAIVNIRADPAGALDATASRLPIRGDAR